jgi:hypothetical protein
MLAVYNGESVTCLQGTLHQVFINIDLGRRGLHVAPAHAGARMRSCEWSSRRDIIAGPSIIIATTTSTLQPPPSVDTFSFLPYTTNKVGLVGSLPVILLPLFRVSRIKICKSCSAIDFQFRSIRLHCGQALLALCLLCCLVTLRLSGWRTMRSRLSVARTLIGR